MGRAIAMLLRRVIEHVRDQNWVAVCLDFLIVVLGVFIGIQVSNWNDAGQREKAKHVALIDLLAESEEIIATIENDIARVAEFLNRAEPVTAAISSGDVETLDPALVAQVVGDARQYRAIAPPRIVYDSLVSSGLFAEMADLEAISSVAQYYVSREAMLNSVEVWQFFIVEEYPHFSEYEGVTAVYDAQAPDRRRFDVDVAAYVASERAREDAVSLFRNQLSFQELRRAFLASAQAMCIALADAAQETCDAVSDDPASGDARRGADD